VQEEFVADTHVVCGDYKWQSFDHESHLANKSFVQDSIDGFSIVVGAIRFASDFGSLGGNELAHIRSLAAGQAGCKRQSGFPMSDKWQNARIAKCLDIWLKGR
jgi:hypothetical protein